MSNFDNIAARRQRFAFKQREFQLISALAQDDEAVSTQSLPSFVVVPSDVPQGIMHNLFQNLPLYKGYEHAVDVLYNRMCLYGVAQDLNEVVQADDPVVGVDAAWNLFQQFPYTFRELHTAAQALYNEQHTEAPKAGTLSEVLSQLLGSSMSLC